jgi:cell division protein ZapA
MGDKLSIKVKIADREYPMKVDANDEENIRKAGKIINERIKVYREKFGIDDKQDLLAMVAFDSMVDKLNNEHKHKTTDQSSLEKVQYLNQLLSQSIQE